LLFSEASLQEQEGDPWAAILLEAVSTGAAEATVGTKFRQAVARAASKRGVEFPPPEEPKLRFIQLLQRYPTILSVFRRPGQDFLVIPAGRSDLVAKRDEALYAIRPDLFRAFTTISWGQPDEKHANYDPSTDSVIWRGYESGAPGCGVPVPLTTQEAELLLRREFAQVTKGPSAASEELLVALSGTSPLQAFSKTIKGFALQREWHSFRTARIVERLQLWAKENQLDWNDAWLVEGPTSRTWASEVTRSRQEHTQLDNDLLQDFFGALDVEDFHRISIPLDLILKAFAVMRKR
jgi:hypothetical protein